MDFLTDRRGIGDEEAGLRAALAAGSLGTALAFESEGYRATRESVLTLLERIGDLDALARMDQAESLEQSDDPALMLTTLRSLLRDLAALRVGATAEALLNADVAERLAPLASGPLGARAVSLGETVGGTRTALRGFASKLLTFDILVDALCNK
jgi:hypothetical protein